MLHFASRALPLRVLCVEEDLVQRKLLQACLDVAGAEALFADSAPRALALFRRNLLDLVLMDFDIHAADELAVFEAMRDDPEVALPILAVTDNECRWSEEDYREVGFAGMFLKPIEPMRLIAQMDHVLRQAQLQPLLDIAAVFTPGPMYLH